VDDPSWSTHSRDQTVDASESGSDDVAVLGAAVSTDGVSSVVGAVSALPVVVRGIDGGDVAVAAVTVVPTVTGVVPVRRSAVGASLPQDAHAMTRPTMHRELRLHMWRTIRDLFRGRALDELNTSATAPPVSS